MYIMLTHQYTTYDLYILLKCNLYGSIYPLSINYSINFSSPHPSTYCLSLEGESIKGEGSVQFLRFYSSSLAMRGLLLLLSIAAGVGYLSTLHTFWFYPPNEYSQHRIMFFMVPAAIKVSNNCNIKMLHVWNTQVHPLLTSKSNPRMPVLVSLFGKRLHWFQMLWRKAGGLDNQIKLTDIIHTLWNNRPSSTSSSGTGTGLLTNVRRWRRRAFPEFFLRLRVEVFSRA